MSTKRPDKTLLVLSQVYIPDPASVGQHVADAAAEMARRGYRVQVLTSARGYDDPTVKYPPKELLNGVHVRRLPLASFGKRSIPIRLLGAGSFLAQTQVRGLFTRNLSAIVVSTSPPMCSVVALIIGTVRRVPIKYWAMDLNPDQMIALGRITERSLAARTFNWFNRMILARAADVIALDRFMARRLNAKHDVSAKMTVLPPWPLDDYLEAVPHGVNPFRRQHNLVGKFVVMYSGNHGPTNPIATILEAAVRLAHRRDLVFLFVGGGSGKKEVEQTIKDHAEARIVSLPYQPLADLKYSLSAADVHLVTVGNEAVGIVHPCKVYGAMAVARPVLLLGPTPCHVSDIVDAHRIGWHIAHGDVDGAVRTLEAILATDPATLAQMGQHARQIVSSSLSKQVLCGKFCDILERGLAPHAAAGPSKATA